MLTGKQRRYVIGGGGYAREGAVSFGPEKADEARAAAAEIAAELRGRE